MHVALCSPAPWPADFLAYVKPLSVIYPDAIEETSQFSLRLLMEPAIGLVADEIIAKRIPLEIILIEGQMTAESFEKIICILTRGGIGLRLQLGNYPEPQQTAYVQQLRRLLMRSIWLEVEIKNKLEWIILKYVVRPLHYIPVTRLYWVTRYVRDCSPVALIQEAQIVKMPFSADWKDSWKVVRMTAMWNVSDCIHINTDHLAVPVEANRINLHPDNSSEIDVSSDYTPVATVPVVDNSAGGGLSVMDNSTETALPLEIRSCPFASDIDKDVPLSRMLAPLGNNTEMVPLEISAENNVAPLDIPADGRLQFGNNTNVNVAADNEEININVEYDSDDDISLD